MKTLESQFQQKTINKHDRRILNYMKQRHSNRSKEFKLIKEQSLIIKAKNNRFIKSFFEKMRANRSEQNQNQTENGKSSTKVGNYQQTNESLNLGKMSTQNLRFRIQSQIEKKSIKRPESEQIVKRKRKKASQEIYDVYGIRNPEEEIKQKIDKLSSARSYNQSGNK